MGYAWVDIPFIYYLPNPNADTLLLLLTFQWVWVEGRRPVTALLHSRSRFFGKRYQEIRRSRGLRGDIDEGERQFTGKGGAIAAFREEFELKKNM